MCNLYTTTKSAAEVARIFKMPGLLDLTGNEPWQTDVYPDRIAPIIRHEGDGLADSLQAALEAVRQDNGGRGGF